MSKVNYAAAHEWPYPVQYGKENEVIADVLIIGGGIAGCHAAISAVKKGAKVAVVDKGPIRRSGAGGAGVDHWNLACTNPCSKITPEEMMDILPTKSYDRRHGPYGWGEHGLGITPYITAKESYDALLDVENLGVKVRDVDNEFVGAPFRDEKTKLMFAYDYDHNFCIRIQGANMKPALYDELKHLGVKLRERIIVTRLLTQGGEPGARVIGATGVNIHTGEFYIFKAKAIVLAVNRPTAIWIETGRGSGTIFEPNATCEGLDMMWKAGVELTMMEATSTNMMSGHFTYLPYSVGNAHKTRFACTLVDSEGKEIPWVDRNGNILKTVEERYHCAAGQRAFTYDGPKPIEDLPEKIAKGEFKLPLYADLPSMPEYDRRAIWGLMVGNEGKTRIPIYETYSKAGFDPDKDMLQVPTLPPDIFRWGAWWKTYGPRQYRGLASAGPVFDWDLKTNLEGLYAAGSMLAWGAAHPGSATTGRYAGRKAAKYASQAPESVIDKKQVDEEKACVYAPINRKDGIGWKELEIGLCRIMQDYCGEYKDENTLKTGLKWLDSIRESEISIAYARNPHELGRTLEIMAHLNVGESIIHACLARKASSPALDFRRLDYPEEDPPEWNKFITIKQENGQVKLGELPFNYWLLPPNAPTYEENYRLHSDL
jgi:succinate dehydrogenase/fumarate reductase flavoprotein subunit